MSNRDTNILIAGIVIILTVSNAFFYLAGRARGYTMGYKKYQACMEPLEHAVVRLKIKNGAAYVTKTMSIELE